MANTTSANVKRVYRMDEITLNQVTEPELLSQGTITIEVKGGSVIDVRGLPENWQYEILDHDSEHNADKPKREALYLATVNILVRSTSPDRAHDVIHCNILSEHDVDTSTLVDWDYVVQNGERQYPRCIWLDLEPENIAELLDLMQSL